LVILANHSTWGGTSAKSRNSLAVRARCSRSASVWDEDRCFFETIARIPGCSQQAFIV
jgi:hypothetical protein